jgi:hypothetical protein
MCFLFIIYFICALVFVFFTYEFFDEFLESISVNQTGVENAKEVYGVKFDRRDLLSMYLGSTYLEWFSVKNPKQTHNYLEMAYHIDQLVRGDDTFEVTQLRGMPLFQNYFVHS